MAGDWVAERLDKEQGASVTDPAVFRGHAAKYEVGGGRGRVKGTDMVLFVGQGGALAWSARGTEGGVKRHGSWRWYVVESRSLGARRGVGGG